VRNLQVREEKLLKRKLQLKSRGVVEIYSCVKAGIPSDNRKYDSSKSGQFESDFMSRKREDEHLVEMWVLSAGVVTEGFGGVRNEFS